MANEKATALQDLPPGSTFGPYRIKRVLGRGGMGVVYEAVHEADARVVALKLLTVDLDKMDARARFLREGQTAAAINHPNTVYIYGTEEIEGTPAITMELVPGGTLDDKIKERGALPLTEAVEDMLQIIDGLEAAYTAGILHRDVKPSNCFVGPGGTIKIGDFGLSKPIGADEQHKLTQSGLFLGTPVFSSPEQLLGEAIDVRSDIYAVGVTFYSLLTGQLPYHSGSMMQVVASVLNGVPAPITNFRKDLPEAVIDVVMKAMARKPADRFQNYAEFHDAVAALLPDQLVAATLWDRFRATIVDWLVNLLLVSIVSVLFLPGAFSIGSGRATDWRQVLTSVVITLLIVGIPEALRGQSIGKWLVGIRVTTLDGAPPGFVREAGRILILAGSDVLTLAAHRYAFSANNKASLALLVLVVYRGTLLVSVRRSNGWRMLHDIATGTRVARARAAVEQRRGEAHRAVAPTLTGTERHVGPYTILGNVRPDGSIQHGWDAAMQRAVWIIARPEQAPEATEARRTLSRLTRLRWVGGRRAPGDSWDAFEAPVGEPLSERLKKPVPWAVQQYWLLDISNEMIAATSDNTPLQEISADSIWVTPTDRLVFPEGASIVSSNDTQNAQSPVTTAMLVAEIFDRVRRARTVDGPLPGYALRTIASARAAATPEQVRSLVQASLGRPVEVSRARRVGMLLATITPMVLFSLIGWLSTSQAKRVDPTGSTMNGLVLFVSDSARTNPDSARKRAIDVEANPRGSYRIARAMESIGLLPVIEPDTITPADTLRHQRHLAEVYLSSVLAARVRDTLTAPTLGRSAREVRARMEILQRNPVIDSAEARAARFLVDTIWKGEIPGSELSTLAKFIPYVLLAAIIILSAGVSIVSGLLARRGPLLRGFQIDVVTASGAPAGRLRLLIRNLVIWSVLLLPIPAVVLAPRMSIGVLGTLLIGSLAVYAAAWAVAFWFAVRTPARGVAERVSGTWLVPE